MTALTEATGDGIAIREAAYELNLPQREPMKMFTDNRAAVFIGEDAAAVRKSKADSRHAIFLQETVEEGIMELKHWPGKDNVADIGTKWLNRHDFEKYRAVTTWKTISGFQVSAAYISDITIDRVKDIRAVSDFVDGGV